MLLAMYTLWGLYQTYPEILDNIELPEEMDKTTMLDYIFMYAGENEVRYSHPAVLERLINKWFSSRKHDFEMMWRALHAEYNPIENTDRYEDFWENVDRTENGTENRTENETENRTENSSSTRNTTNDTMQEFTAESTASGTGSNTSTNTRTPNLTNEEVTSAFDSDTYQPRNKRTDSGTENTEQNENSTSSDTMEQNGNRKSTQSGNETGAVENTVNAGRDNTVNAKTDNTLHNELKHGLHSHGNIGVTTNQRMITEELELRKFDIYKSIALVFEDEFTIPVYERRSNEYGLL